MTARRVRTLVIVLVAALLGSGIVHASAAQLTVRSATMLSVTKAPCTTATVAVTHGSISTTDQKTSSVVVTVPAACGGLPVALRLFTAGGVALHAADLTVASASAPTTTVTLSTADRYTPSEVVGAALTIGTWGMRTAWTFTPPVSATGCKVVRLNGNGVEIPSPSATCTITQVAMQGAAWWGTKPARQTNIDVTFTSTGAAYPDYFVFTVNLATVTGLPTDWNWSTSGTGNGNPVVRSACSALPLLTASSPTTWGPPPSQYFPLYENRAGNAVSCS